MIASNVTMKDLQKACYRAKVKLRDVRQENRKGTRIKFRLKPFDGKYNDWLWYRMGYSGRKVHAVCWHGHLRFFRELYNLCPKAKIITRDAKYNSRDDLEDKKMDSYLMNMGSMIRPMIHGKACFCELRQLAKERKG